MRAKITVARLKNQATTAILPAIPGLSLTSTCTTICTFIRRRLNSPLIQLINAVAANAVVSHPFHCRCYTRRCARRRAAACSACSLQIAGAAACLAARFRGC